MIKPLTFSDLGEYCTGALQPTEVNRNEKKSADVGNAVAMLSRVTYPLPEDALRQAERKMISTNISTDRLYVKREEEKNHPGTCVRRIPKTRPNSS